MISKTEILERDILRVFRCACRQDRSDIAEFMLAALEKLDREGSDTPREHGPLIDAYQEIAGIGTSQK
jgi:hypothetical protein